MPLDLVACGQSSAAACCLPSPHLTPHTRFGQRLNFGHLTLEPLWNPPPPPLWPRDGGVGGATWGQDENPGRQWARYFGVPGPCVAPPPPPCIQPIPSLHHILFLLMWKISSAVPCPPFWPARLSWKLHPACVGVDRVGSKREEMVTGDSGLCLSPCSCVSNPYPAAAPRPRPPPPPPRALAPVFVSIPPPVFSSLGSVSISDLSHSHRCLSTFSRISIPPAAALASSGLAAILSPARPSSPPRSEGGLAWS